MKTLKQIHLPGGVSSSEVEPYVRPSDWLALPAVAEGEHKFVGLYAVFPHESNFVAFLCVGAYTVDWGDGSAPQNFNSGTVAQKNYVYSNLGAGTETSRGYRQALVMITPQVTGNLVTINLLLKYNQPGLIGGSTSGWLDIRIVGANIATLTIGGATTNISHRMLEQFEFVGTNAVTSFVNKFQNCTSLRSLVSLYTGAATDFSTMFGQCSMLKTIPMIDTANGNNFANMFSFCANLEMIPTLNTANGINFAGMFNQCPQLKIIPLLDTSKGTSFTFMFDTCRSLTEIPLLDTSQGTTFGNMFNACSALKKVPLINTALGTNFSNMFASCTTLTTIPLINTVAGIVFNGMFSGCSSLMEIPALNLSNGTSFVDMVRSTALVSIPLMDTSKGTNFATMFAFSTAFQSVPALNVSAGLSLANMFLGCPSIRSSPLVGTRASISYFSCSLGPAALDAIYEGLAATTNILTENAASVETNIADWNAVSNCVMGRSIIAADGAWGASLTSSATGNLTMASASRLAVSPSTLYTFLMTAMSTGGSRAWSLSLAWYNSSGVLISTDSVSTLTATTVFGQGAVTATSPANAATVSLISTFTATAASQVFAIDKMGLFPGVVSDWTPGRATITVTGNWGNTADNPSIATDKGWTVVG